MHFVALDTIDIADKWYYAHVDATQMIWLDEDLSMVPAETPIITFNHIPLFSAVLHGWGYYPDGGSLIEIDGREQYRHMSRTTPKCSSASWTATTRSRSEAMATPGRKSCWATAASRRDSINRGRGGDTGKREGMQYASGVTLYRMRDGKIEGWEFILLDDPSGSVDSQS